MEVKVTRELKEEIKVLILESLNIPDVGPEDIADDASLFEDENLGLDSIDGLEIVMALQEKYGVRIDDQNQARFILKSIDTIAEFIAKELSKK
ncbi:MAG TPA: phosphopantetheine-binding protein [Spirochaetota bacterium]|nr:phosphopantetheine-binding protein [Spirochaetota bacterium]HRZ26724.1 phosphopantetheine-binding protein [Spirochaetota bacterium]HSA13487.1 phosphopantetheine-binding protein [Spirochaetota bacterium]